MMNQYSKDLNLKIEKAKESYPYRIYLDTRETILAMLDEFQDNKIIVSKYWREELAGFEYLFDSSPLIIQKLREHSYHITGQYSYTYRRHHAHRSSPFRRKFRQLQMVDRKNLFVEESKAPSEQPKSEEALTDVSAEPSAKEDESKVKFHKKYE